MPVIPPWIKAADPAAHMAQGMHIGIQIGAQQAQERMRQQQMAARAAEQQQEMDAQQAAQRFKEVQAAKQEQLHARDQALAESKYGLMASQAAQKHQAMQEYQTAVTGGMDPNEAMLKWGPAMSANTGAAAAIRANRVPKSWNEVTLPSGLKTVQSSTGDMRFAPRDQEQVGLPSVVDIEGQKMLQVPNVHGGFHYQNAPAVKRNELTAYQTLMDRDRTERRLDKIMSDNSQFDLSEDSVPGEKWSKTKVNQWKGLKKQADTLRKRLEDIQAPAPTAAANGRVRVKSPDGKTGSIPADQLDDAVAHGYTQVQ